MIVFLGLAFVSCLVNYQSNLVQNVISAIYIFISAIMMLPFNSNKNIDEKAKEFKIFSWIAVSLTFVCAVTSILIFLFNFKYSYAIGFQQYVFGVFEGRLWGIQGNPNTLAQFALMSIWLSVALIIMNKHYSGSKNFPLCEYSVGIHLLRFIKLAFNLAWNLCFGYSICHLVCCYKNPQIRSKHLASTLEK